MTEPIRIARPATDAERDLLGILSPTERLDVLLVAASRKARRAIREEESMLNDAAKKIVAREANAQLPEARRQIDAGAHIEDVIERAWEVSCANTPDLREWRRAFSCYESILLDELV